MPLPVETPDEGATLENPDANGVVEPKDTFSRSDMEAFAKEYSLKKLRGSGKEITKLQTELERLQAEKEAAAQKALAEQGEFKTLYEGSQSKIDAMKAELDAAVAIAEEFKAKHAAKLEALEAENLKQIELIPEEWRDVIPEGLDPETKAKQIANLMAKIQAPEQSRGNGIMGGMIRPPTPATKMTDEQKREARKQAALDKMMGKVKK